MQKEGGNIFNKRNKKALSTIVATLLILLLVFVAVGILWVVIRNVIVQGTEQVSLGKFTLDLKIEKVTVQGNNLNVKVKRNPGEGDFTGLSFILDDGDNTEVFDVTNLSMDQYSEKTFQITLSELNANDIIKIEVAPIFTLSSGKEVVGPVKSEWNKPGATPSGTPSNCGNGIINSGEDCDGTNISSTATCASVLSASGATGTLSCTSTCDYNTNACVLPSCGNGQINTGEQCDGSNLNSGTCTSVLGATATGTLSCSATSCQYVTSGCALSVVCGNGAKQTGEGCDDGDTSNGDGCSSTCTVESGYNCTENTAGLSTCTQTPTQTCGNGIKEGTEGCDDGDTSNGDGCSSTCTVESGYSCTGTQPSVCSPLSGTPTKHEFYDGAVTENTRLGGINWRSQSFTIGNTGANENFAVTSIKFYGEKDGSPGTLTAEIYAASGDIPTGSALSSGTLAEGSISDTDSWNSVTMSYYTLQAGTKYVLVLRTSSGAAETSNQVIWRQGAGGYDGGEDYDGDNGGTSWVSGGANYDNLFEIWGTSA